MTREQSKTLDLPLKAKWYDMIEAGIKTEEYREIKLYWIRRLCWHNKYEEVKCPANYCSQCYHDGRCVNGNYVFCDYTHVRFRYGYTKRTMLREIKNITLGYGNPDWGAPKDKQVFIIKFKG